MVCNIGMNQEKSTQLEADRALIERFGGPSKLAQLLGFSRVGGVQRVQNWKVRGIPSNVKLAYPDVFLAELKAAKRRKPIRVAA